MTIHTDRLSGHIVSSEPLRARNGLDCITVLTGGKADIIDRPKWLASCEPANFFLLIEDIPMPRKTNRRKAKSIIGQIAGRTIRITDNRRSVLDLLSACGKLTRSQITSALPERANGISQTLSDLRAFGFVEHHRNGCPQQHKWSITDRGRAVIANNQSIVRRAFRDS
ncbi:MAG: hypothetical protein ACR2PI_19000 [Hyphomicrobiaceae bacterium]